MSLLDVFGADPKFSPASSDTLRRCLREGALVASQVVWAETATVFADAGRFSGCDEQAFSFLLTDDEGSGD
jgi:hypothetical protein